MPKWKSKERSGCRHSKRWAVCIKIWCTWKLTRACARVLSSVSSLLSIHFALVLCGYVCNNNIISSQRVVIQPYYIPFVQHTTPHEAITNNEVAKAADIPTQNVVVRFSEAWVHWVTFWCLIISCSYDLIFFYSTMNIVLMALHCPKATHMRVLVYRTEIRKISIDRRLRHEQIKKIIPTHLNLTNYQTDEGWE